jgi:hypothetical protein
MKRYTLEAVMIPTVITEEFYKKIIPELHKMGVTPKTEILLSRDAQKCFSKQRDINAFITALKRRLEAYQSALKATEPVAA